MFTKESTYLPEEFVSCYKPESAVPLNRGNVNTFIFLLIIIFIFYSQLSGAQNFRSSSGGSSVSGVNTLTVSKPTGTTYGDVMIAAIACKPDASVITAPAGWNLIRRTNQPSGAPNAQAVYWKAAGESEPSAYSWAFDASTGSVGAILTFYNINPLTPIHVEAGQTTVGSGALTHSAPVVTTTVNNAMLVTAYSFGSSATWTPPSGMTEAVDVASLAVPNAGGISMGVNYAVQGTAGSTGTKTATASGDDDAAVSQIIALVPSSSAFNAFKTGNWSDKSTWATNRFGVISCSTTSTIVSGSGTLFTKDLMAGDMLYNSNFSLIGTVASIQSNTQLTLTGNALLGLSGTSFTSGLGRRLYWDSPGYYGCYNHC